MKSIAMRRRQLGQGMMEYIIIVALIAVAAIGVYSLFGKTVRNQTAGLAQEMAGVDASAQIKAASTAAAAAASKANTAKNMSSYNQNLDSAQ
ncbi:MAG: pilus assembly protein [Burkholderiaceae bacterium]|nr:pilus assembly protein [Burkholderiaceae bacterium]